MPSFTLTDDGPREHRGNDGVQDWSGRKNKTAVQPILGNSLDALVKERDSILATLEILADGSLTEHLLQLSKTIGKDIAAGR